MKNLLVWWFLPQKRFSFVIKALVGIVIIYRFLDVLISNIVDLIDAFANPPLYLDSSFLLLPIISTLLSKEIFYSALFYLPYIIFRKRIEDRKRYLIRILLVVLIMVTGLAGVGMNPKPSSLRIFNEQVSIFETKLGTADARGDYFTTRELANMIENHIMKVDTTENNKGKFPEIFFNRDEGFSELVLYYMACRAGWVEYEKLPMDMESSIFHIIQELYGSKSYSDAKSLLYFYNMLPSTPSSPRIKYRLNNPDVDLSLLFWGKVSKVLYPKGSLAFEAQNNLFTKLMNQYNLNDRSMPPANWTTR